MTVGQYITASGTAGPSEQDTLDRLDEFMSGALGWNRIDVVSDTGTDNDRVWYSEGEVPGKYAPMYVRARANGDDIIFHGYTLWNPGTSTGSDEIANATELQVPNDNNGGSDEYVFFGNKDAVFVSIRLNSNGSNYMGGFGYWDTYYTVGEDPYPLWVMGQNSNADTFNNTFRVRSYGEDPDGFLNVVATYSGGVIGFIGTDDSARTALATPNPRDARHLMLKNTFYRRRSDTEGDIPGAISHEVRGEIPGMYQFYGSNFVANDMVIASGVATGDGIPGDDLGTGTFVVVRSSQTNTMALGPADSWAPTPPTVSGLEMWLSGNAVYRRAGGDLSGGAVRGWIDLSGEGNEAAQTTEADQPEPVSSGTVFNGQPTVRFDGSNHLTGALTYTNNYTAFVVADYDDTTRKPLFYVRGDISSNDNIFSLEFNKATADTAVAYVRVDGSPVEEDEETYASLSVNTAYIVSVVVSGTLTTLYVDGDSTGSSTTTDTKTSFGGSAELNYGIGATLNSSGAVDGTAYHNGEIAEAIVYNRNLTAEEHQNIVCYLGDKYGITVAGSCV